MHASLAWLFKFYIFTFGIATLQGSAHDENFLNDADDRSCIPIRHEDPMTLRLRSSEPIEIDELVRLNSGTLFHGAWSSSDEKMVSYCEKFGDTTFPLTSGGAGRTESIEFDVIKPAPAITFESGEHTWFEASALGSASEMDYKPGNTLFCIGCQFNPHDKFLKGMGRIRRGAHEGDCSCIKESVVETLLPNTPEQYEGSFAYLGNDVY